MNINKIKAGDFVIESEFVSMYGRSLFTTYEVISVDGSDQPTITLKLYKKNFLGLYDNPNNRKVWYNALKNYTNVIKYL